MSYKLSDKFRLKPGVFWCCLRGQRIRTTVERCGLCSEALYECMEFLEELARVQFGGEPFERAGGPDQILIRASGERYKFISGRWRKLPRRGHAKLPRKRLHPRRKMPSQVLFPGRAP